MEQPPPLHAGYLIRGIPAGILENAVTLAQLIRRAFPDIEIRDVKRYRRTLLFIRAKRQQDQFRLRNIPDWKTVQEFRYVVFQAEHSTKPNAITPKKFKTENNMIVIKGIHPAITTDQVIHEMNKEVQQVTFATRMRSAARSTPIYKIKALFATSQLALKAIDNGVQIGFKQYNCEWYRVPPQPPHCSQCLHWGHTQDTCQEDARCYKCGSQGHLKRDCPEENIKCFHCKLPHSAAYRGCASYKEYLKQQQQQQQIPASTTPVDIPTTIRTTTQDAASNTDPPDMFDLPEETTMFSVTTQVSSDASSFADESGIPAMETKQVAKCLLRLKEKIIRKLPTYLQEDFDDFLNTTSYQLFKINMEMPPTQLEKRRRMASTPTSLDTTPALSIANTTFLFSEISSNQSEKPIETPLPSSTNQPEKSTKLLFTTGTATYTRPDPRRTVALTETETTGYTKQRGRSRQRAKQQSSIFQDLPN